MPQLVKPARPRASALVFCVRISGGRAGRGEGGGGWISAWRFLCVSKSLQSCLTLCDPMDCSLPGSFVHGDSPGKNTGVCCHYLLQGIFPTQGLSQPLLCLLHWQAGSLSLTFFLDWCSSNSEDCPYTGLMIYGPPTSVSCTPSTF